jgi:lipoic acid synthetase
MAKKIDGKVYTKSGMMVGLGEQEEEVLSVMRDLREAGCSILTIGQYLRPMKENLEVSEYVRPEVFERYAEAARGYGFLSVASSSFVRSSYNAEEVFTKVSSGK